MTHSTIEMDAMDNDEPSLEDIAGVSALADDLLDDDEFDGIYGDDLFVEDDDDSYDMSDPYDIEYDIP